MEKAFWAEPRDVISIDDCYFYHTMDIPNHGMVRGEWDLRGREASYLGKISFHAINDKEWTHPSAKMCSI